MRLRNVKGSREQIAENEYVLKNAENNKGKWKEFFQDDKPIHLEIGMGKGRFLMEMAKLHPDIHYIGIEKYSSVLVRALEKMEEEPLPNIHFLRMDAEYITQYFDKGEVAEIYLNFSDPWPKTVMPNGVSLPGSFSPAMMRFLPTTAKSFLRQITGGSLISPWKR